MSSRLAILNSPAGIATKGRHSPIRSAPRPRLRLTDTTFRDGNQSLLGGHLRGSDIIPIAQKLDAVGLFALEAFRGATFETYLRQKDDPWDYLRRLREATPHTPIQALIRGQNLVGSRNYADDAVELFVATAARNGVDIFRVFDPLNDLRNMEVAIAAAHKAGRRVQGALCYAITPAHDLTLWCSLAKGLVEFGIDDLVIKDTSGLLSPQATWELVTALRETVDEPVVVHSHCGSGMAPMAYMAAVEAGALGLDTAMSPLAWGASQPATESVVAALAGGDYDTGLDLEKLVEIKIDLDELKKKHLEHLSPAADRIDSDILRYQMPAFMLEDIHRQLDRHNALGRIREALGEVPRVRHELGYPPLVAPIRQIIATQAVYNVLGESRYATVSQELKDYLQGLYGAPPRPADSEVRRQVLGQEEPITIRPADLLDPQTESARSRLQKRGLEGTDEQVLTYLMFPTLGLELFQAQAAPPAPSGEATEPSQSAALAATGPSGDLVVEEETPSPQSAAELQQTDLGIGPASPPVAEFDVEVEGEVFHVRVAAAGPVVTQVGPPAGAAAGEAVAAAPQRPRDGAITAPMQGLIVKVPVRVGDEVKLGDVVAVLEAMKMQNDIVTTRPGKVLEVYVREGQVVSPNQALVVVG
ncbi:MAG TPA: pyruvate carboxylase subunit B [Candidatus Dormibacteraeota bacterium]|nr:pyruvate carboxylase subunit B [Candidatus Dormibacteraeota bacterium]